MSTNTSSHWRDAARTPRFFFVDAFAAFPLVLMLLHIRMWTFLVAIGAMTFFMILERFKFTLPVFRRWVKTTLAGPIRTAYPWWRQ